MENGCTERPPAAGTRPGLGQTSNPSLWDGRVLRQPAGRSFRSHLSAAAGANPIEGGPSAGFLAHLIATRSHAPQTRVRRRAEPGDAVAAYGAAAAALLGGRTMCRLV